MIQIQTETLVLFGELPAWCEAHLGRRISPSTLHRWRLRGCRGVKLETLLTGGKRVTSVEALQRFFEASTRAQDGLDPLANHSTNSKNVAQAEAYLDSEWQ